VELVQAGLASNWWARDFRVVSESLAGEQVDADRRVYAVPVPANGRAEVTVIYETRY